MKARLLVIACVAVAIASIRADLSVPTIEYRVLKSIDQVRLTAGFIHDPDLQARVMGRRAAFEQEGIVLVSVDAPRRFVREVTLAGHTVKTELSLYPPGGRGYKGGVSSAYVVVTVDGRKRVDCPWSAGTIELSDLSILPVDGFISVEAARDDKLFRALLFLNSEETVTSEWLTKHGS